MSSNVIAIIPARGGSKGIPRENLLVLGGKPVIEHSIECARHTSSISRIVVSTDDPDIGDCARKTGAEVIWRPAELCGDTATSESALVHARDCLETTESYIPDLVIFIQPTSPCRQPHDIEKAIAQLHRENADWLFTACPVPGFVWRRTADDLTPVSYE